MGFAALDPSYDYWPRADERELPDRVITRPIGTAGGPAHGRLLGIIGHAWAGSAAASTLAGKPSRLRPGAATLGERAVA